jgi:hypothetical protein
MSETESPIERQERDLAQASCPRCGYDQRGVIATWSVACPLRGTCAECALEWWWADVLNPTLALPAWNIETAENWPQSAVRTIRTTFMLVRPFHFWRQVRMTHELRAQKLWFSFVWFPLLLYAIFAVSSGVTAWRTLGYTTAPKYEKLVTSVYATILPFSQQPPRWLLRPSGLPQWSPAMFSTAGLGLQIDDFRRVGTALLVADIRLLPFPYGLKSLIWLIALGLMATMTPLSFAVIPFSRTQAKVKVVHLIRIGLYSLIPIGLVIVIGHGIGILMWIGLSYWLVIKLVATSVFWYPMFLAVWWSAAAKNYLRMPHAWVLGTSFASIGFLATLLIAAVLTMLFHG